VIGGGRYAAVTYRSVWRIEEGEREREREKEMRRARHAERQMRRKEMHLSQVSRKIISTDAQIASCPDAHAAAKRSSTR